MEIPSNLKTLYNHWSLHTGKGNDPFPTHPLYLEMKGFIEERISIWRKKSDGGTSPLTHDPILSKYRFCNIFREFDRQTIEFHTLLNPLRSNFSLWLLNMFYFRMVAKTQTVQALGLLNLDDNRTFYKKFISLPRPKFGSPYLFPISVIQASQTPTRELFIAEYLPTIIERVANEIQSWEKRSVSEGLEIILPIFGYNLHFLWTEVLIDTAYQFPEHLNLFDSFPIGPGAKPTMQRIEHTVEELAKMNFKTGLTYEGEPLKLSAENWEGIFCEFRKYTNLKSGKGRKRIYK